MEDERTASLQKFEEMIPYRESIKDSELLHKASRAINHNAYFNDL